MLVLLFQINQAMVGLFNKYLSFLLYHFIGGGMIQSPYIYTLKRYYL